MQKQQILHPFSSKMYPYPLKMLILSNTIGIRVVISSLQHQKRIPSHFFSNLSGHCSQNNCSEFCLLNVSIVLKAYVLITSLSNFIIVIGNI